mmetsp:Transcript_672/g.1198  ORF Transcript_672/g.1198 Transcript_672/m.1198 type:complete len:308 (-) Transcript_672:1598-2521(-)
MELASAELTVYLYLLLLSLWVVLTLWYLIGNILQHPQYVRRLHTLFVWACAVKSVSLACKLLDSMMHENDPILQFWSYSTEGLASVFIYVTWALYCKGFTVTEADFGSMDLSSISCMASAIYSVYCFYILDTNLLNPIILILHCWLILIFIRYIHATLQLLHYQLHELSRAQVDQLVTVTKKKIKIFRWVSLSIYVYFILYIILAIAAFSIKAEFKDLYGFWLTLWQFLQFIVMAFILVLLRPRDMGELYYVPVANTIGLTLAPFYSARLPQSLAVSPENNATAPIIFLPPTFPESVQVGVGIPIGG